VDLGEDVGLPLHHVPHGVPGHGLDVAAGAEDLPAGPGEDHDLGLRVLIGGQQDVGDILPDLGLHGVAHVLPVEGDDPDPVPLFPEQILELHFFPFS
jgi:hypothetical protein